MMNYSENRQIIQIICQKQRGLLWGHVGIGSELRRKDMHRHALTNVVLFLRTEACAPEVNDLYDLYDLFPLQYMI